MNGSEYVASQLSHGQDFLDWWQGPIGFMLPNADQWDNFLIQTSLASAAAYGVSRLELAGVIGGAKVHTHWFTGAKYTKDIVRAGRTAKKISMLRTLGILTLYSPTPVSMGFWAVTIATSLPPSKNPSEWSVANAQRMFTGTPKGPVYS